MKSFGILLIALLPLTALAEDEGYLWSFDRDPVGQLPPRFAPSGGAWTVAAETNAPTRPNVLVADGSSVTNGLGAVCVLDKVQLATGQIWTRALIETGSAGLVFRRRGSDTFCKLTANAEDNRLTLVAVRAGVTQELASCVVKAISRLKDRWHRIGAELDGRNIRCYFDGELKLTAQEDLLVTASRDHSAVGLILSPGARAKFDDLTVDVNPLSEEARTPDTLVEVTVTKEKIFLRETALTIEELTDKLRKRFEPTQRLVLRVDKDVEYERIEQLMKAGASIGFEKISLELRK